VRRRQETEGWEARRRGQKTFLTPAPGGSLETAEDAEKIGKEIAESSKG